MKRTILLILFLVISQITTSQESNAFQSGEWFKFKMSYSGFLKAGNATLEVVDDTFKGQPVYHVIGKGWTTGAIKWFFKVEDLYESYFDKQSGLPYKFIRKIDEGGHTKDIEIEFDHENRKAYVNNLKYNKKTIEDTQKDVQDLVSAYYYLRNNYSTEDIKVGDEVSLNMFFDSENFNFKLRFLGRDEIRTKFGKVKTLKFRPLVLAGRVFKEEESLTIWVSADENKIPLRMKASLAVGSLRADLTEFKGLKHPSDIKPRRGK